MRFLKLACFSFQFNIGTEYDLVAEVILQYFTKILLGSITAVRTKR